MKISSSDISLSAEHLYSQKSEKSESMNYWVGDRPQGNGGGEAVSINIVDIVDISEHSQKAYKDNMSVKKTDGSETLFKLSEQDKNKIALLEAFMEKVTGKKIAFKLFEKVTIKRAKEGASQAQANPQNTRVGWGFEYNLHESYEETEKLSFSAKGVVKTEDGSQINIALELNMSRQFVSENNLQIKAGDALIDPIVVNFAGGATQLTQQKYVFDLDSDGTGDEISFVGSGSGLLALDKNGDGVINNGTELFGPNTQDGFSELAEYDSDNNGWIDENDAVYDNLRIWVKDENGNDTLFALGQKGVGAIYLGNAETQFSYKDTDNSLLGQMRASSIYLSDNGNVGTVHQIDLAK